MDLTRENFTQLVDTPERRAFMRKLAAKGWLGMTWPKQYGGGEREGVYEYILNEALARYGAPQIGKGVGIIGKTLIRHGSEFLKQKFLPQIIRAEIEFAVGYSEPEAGSDAANMQLRATREGDGWRLNGQKIWTTSAHFADWYWVGARTDPEQPGARDPEHAHHRQGHHQPGLLRQRLRGRRPPRRRAEQGIPVHLGSARPRAIHDVHVLTDRGAHETSLPVRA
jgi:alkylation response protein AidB-like acyl-CoA dehydrogenase